MIFSDAFMAIADPNRRYLLEELRRGPKTVNELAAGLPVSRPAVSQHLKVLLDAGLVNAKRRRHQARLCGQQRRLPQTEHLARPVLGSMRLRLQSSGNNADKGRERYGEMT